MDGAVLCASCQMSFSHIAHLEEHKSSHCEQRRFKCSTCSKAFPRKDSLQRHELVHRRSASLVRTKGRACINCVTSKTRCTGEAPCARCITRKLPCQYRARCPPMVGGNISSETAAVTDSSETEPPQQTLWAEPAPGRQFNRDFQEVVTTQQESGPTPMDFAPTQYHQSFPNLETDDYRPILPPMLANTSVVTYENNDTSQVLWSPVVSPTINWLSNGIVNLDYAELNDLFPVFYSTEGPSPASVSEIRNRERDDTHKYMMPPPTSLSGGSPTTSTMSSIVSPHTTHSIPHTTSTRSGDSSMSQDTERGTYYVDGDEARLSRCKKRRLLSVTTPTSLTTSGFSLECPPSLLRSDGPIRYLDEQQYHQMQLYFNSLCVDSALFRPFTNHTFLPQLAVSCLIEHYFRHFHQTLPFFHGPTFQGTKRHVALLLAMAALGTRFVEDTMSESMCTAFNEFMRRLLIYMDENGDMRCVKPLELAQLRILHSVASQQSISEKSRRSAVNALRDCTLECETNWYQLDLSEIRSGHENQWQSWLDREEHIRTNFSIWLVDSILTSQTQHSAFLKLATAAECQLPCHESVWSAESSQEWEVLSQKNVRPPSLQAALQNLYVEKRLLPDLGEFARVLVIHGLFHKTWDVQEYMQQGLSHFEPSAQKQSSDSIPVQLPNFHPHMAVFNKWRNSACDCLDTLHWSANAMIGSAHGMEHPTVLHLHFARVVLLTPLKQIVRLAKLLSESKEKRASRGLPSEQAKTDMKLVQEWAVQDQYKARLAAVHAGVLFWHVRRYSIGAFYEADALALSTLMLWALSVFSRKGSKTRTNTTGEPDAPESQSTPAARSASPVVCDIILLDRPTDDELVQQYVRQGHTMHANMTGVGDLLGPLGAQRVLAEGRKLLTTLDVWKEPVASWRSILEKLERVTEHAAVDNSAQKVNDGAR